MRLLKMLESLVLLSMVVLACCKQETPPQPTRNTGGVSQNHERQAAPPSGKILKPAEFKEWVIKYGPTKVVMPRDLRFSKDGKYIAIAAGGRLEIRDGVSLQHIRVLDSLFENGTASDANAVDFSPSSNWVAFDWHVHKSGAMTDDIRIVIANWKDERIERTLNVDGLVHSVRFSSDGRWLCAVGIGTRGNREVKDVRVWDTQTWEVRFETHLSGGGTGSCEFSLDGKWLITMSWGPLLTLFDTTTWRSTSKADQKHVSAVGFVESAQPFALFGREVTEDGWPKVLGRFVVFDSAMTMKTGVNLEFTSNGTDVSIHPTCRWIASGTGSGVSIQNTDGKTWYAFDTEGGAATSKGITFSPDGKSLGFVFGGTCMLLRTDWLK